MMYSSAMMKTDKAGMHLIGMQTANLECTFLGKLYCITIAWQFSEDME